MPDARSNYGAAEDNCRGSARLGAKWATAFIPEPQHKHKKCTTRIKLRERNEEREFGTKFVIKLQTVLRTVRPRCCKTVTL